ncbi:MAG: ABC transporter substrate-binding protein [Chloroflexi bacterium]|nr:ABC transporter substrate-binding protein [Chloroflexota bacterium]
MNAASLSIGLAMVAMLSVTSCGQNAAPSAPVSSAGNPPAANASASGAASGVVRSSGAVPVRVGVTDPPNAANSAYLVALDKGFFAEQGIDIQEQVFNTAPALVAPIAAGQVDVGSLGINAGLFNALNRGIKVAMVADSASISPGFDNVTLVVRKALVDGGKYKSAADFKGMKFAIVSKGTVSDYGLDKLMKTVGMTYKDLDLQILTFPDMRTALLNGAIDAAWEIEPFSTQILETGQVVLVKHGADFVPGAQLASVAMSPQFLNNRDVATRWLAAYLKGARIHNDAYGKKDPAARAEVFSILKKHIPGMTDALLDKMGPAGADPNGKLDVASIDDQQKFFVASGSQEKLADLNQLVDAKLAEDAVKLLGGPYK